MENSIKPDKDNKKKASALERKEQQNSEYVPSVYLRDDHCDWGSSGMNEYTKEFENIQ